MNLDYDEMSNYSIISIQNLNRDTTNFLFLRKEILSTTLPSHPKTFLKAQQIFNKFLAYK